MTSNPARYGFTLVELVVVIAVLAVVSAVAVPRFASASARSRLDAAASRVVQDIGITSATASAAGSDRQIVYDSLLDQYVMVGVRSRGGGLFRSVRIGAAPYETNLVSATFDGAPMLTINGHGVAETNGVINLALGRFGKRIVLSEGSSGVQVRSLALGGNGSDTNVMPGVESVTGDRTVDVGVAAAPIGGGR